MASTFAILYERIVLCPRMMGMTGRARRGIDPKTWLVVGTTAAVVLGIVLDVPRWLRGPAPFPPEWQWRLRVDASIARIWPAVVAATGVLAFLAWTTKAKTPKGRASGRLWIVSVAVVLGLAWQLALLHTEAHGTVATVARWFGARGSSYFTVARRTVGTPVSEFLTTYRNRLPTLPLHAATHPPGPILYFRALLAVTEMSPSLTAATLRTARFVGVDSFEARPPDGTVLTGAELAAVWLGGFGLAVIGLLTCWPLASLAMSAGATPRRACAAAVLWVLTPAASFFFGDSFMTCLVTTWAALVCIAGRRASAAARFATGAAAGVTAACACFVSFGAPPLLVATGLGACLLAARHQPPTRRSVAAVGTGVVMGFAFACAIPVALGYDLTGTAREALRIHHEQYTATRAYRLWLRYNLLDFCLFLGWPITAAAIAALVDATRRAWAAASPGRQVGLLGVMVAAVAVLDVSGVTRGEVGRLWMPLMPMTMLGVLAADGSLAGSDPSVDGRTNRDSVWLVVLGVLLAAVTLAIWMSWVSAFEVVVR